MADQTIPDNSGTEDSGNRRQVVESVTAPTDVSIKNPKPIKVKMRDKDGRQFALDEANGLMSKFKKQLSMAAEEVPKMGGGLEQITKYIKKMDPGNTSGAVKPALDILDKLLKDGNKNPLGSIPGILGGLMGQLQQALNQIAKDNKKVNDPAQPDECPKGQKWSDDLKMCVIDKEQPPNFLDD